MKIAMIRTGCMSVVCFSDFWHHVVCVDKATDKAVRLSEGGLPLYEPGFEEDMARKVATGRRCA